MFYLASKALFLIFQPSSLALIGVGVGLWLVTTTRRRLGYWFAGTGLVILLAGGFLPIGNWVILPLEERFAETQIPQEGDRVAGIIMLGGFEDGWVSSGRGGLAVNEAAERLTEGVRLARRWPNAKLVFTGGVAGLLAPGARADGAVGAFLKDVGIEPGRVVLEGKSRNTYENAIFTRELVSPKPSEIWLLVTSAYHMPRAVGVFRRAGFGVVAAPTDFRTHGWLDASRLFESMPRGLKRLDTAVKEWIGLAAYWMSGRTESLFPGP